jgi:hypothetical protein
MYVHLLKQNIKNREYKNHGLFHPKKRGLFLAKYLLIRE